MKVLLIDNTRDPDSWGSEELRRAIVLPAGRPAGVQLTTRRAPHGDFPGASELSRYDRIVLSGSATSINEDAPWIDSLLEVIRRVLDQKIPLLGVCYGHQMLARALGGKACVRRAGEPEIGWARIRLNPSSSSPLFSGLGREFHSFAMHYDEVAALPEGCTLLASSELCPIQAFSVDGAPAFGVQFHPERDQEGARQTFAAKSRLKPVPPLLHPDRGHELHDPAVAAAIFGNFISGEATP